MRPSLPTLVLAQLVLTAFLCGLIWVVQGVLYPLFALVGPAEFPAFHSAEMNRIGWIVAPLMTVELLLALGAVLSAPRDSLPWLAAAFLAVVWASTAFIQVPLHQELSVTGYDAERLGRLTAGNWIRTLAWTARGVVLWVWLRRLLRTTG
ncbi:MAG TPA: hypothetical protein PKX00_22870 [Opitutaceae bacterium]|jgi:hypothetical protein|nr:hypothetical protein [Opitutaceae bacterium]HRE08481.1 hypothetical protein [Opitutaceae bacterium]